MSPVKKTIIGVLTVAPILFFILYFISFFSFIQNIEAIEQTGNLSDGGLNMGSFTSLFVYMLIAVVLSFAMLIYYIIDIVNNPKFKKPGDNNKLVWILLVVLASTLGMIAYFFVEIYPRKQLPPIPKDANTNV